jgi:hypothetical protein
MLSASFGALSNGLPSHDGLLFLPEPLYFLLNPGQLLLFCCGFIFFSFLIPILHLHLIELSIALNILYWWEPTGVIGVGHLHWLRWNWCLHRSGWTPLSWLTLWLVGIARVQECHRRLGVQILRRWWTGFDWMVGGKGIGFHLRLGVNLHLG